MIQILGMERLIYNSGLFLLQSFLSDSSLYQILFSIIANGPTLLEVSILEIHVKDLTKNDKNEEMLIYQDLLKEALILLETIIRYRISQKVNSNSINL
jgi:hypothetical protein